MTQQPDPFSRPAQPVQPVQPVQPPPYVAPVQAPQPPPYVPPASTLRPPPYAGPAPTAPTAPAGAVVIELDEDRTEPADLPDRSGRRRRELVGVSLWALAALAWVVAMFVPWFRAGVASSTSPIEAAALLRAGVLGVPSVAGWAVLLLPATSLLLLGIAPLRGGGAMAARVLLWLVGTALGIVLVVVLARISASTFGVGAVLVVTGCVLGGIALGCATVRVPKAPPAAR